MAEEKSYPIAELFESVQGEGYWMGTRMAFVRLAGCNVGKPYPEGVHAMIGLEPYQDECTDWAGYKFPCDTNYRKVSLMSAKEIAQTKEVARNLRVSITGGEPMIHDLIPLTRELFALGQRVHLETSGTIELGALLAQCDKWGTLGRLWITVSPKIGCLDSSLVYANDIRIMVGDRFDEAAFKAKYEKYFAVKGIHLWLSPVNGLSSILAENMARCVELQKKYGRIRISVQLHKILNVR